MMVEDEDVLELECVEYVEYDEQLVDVDAQLINIQFTKSYSLYL
jgi:hypothetical protein